MRQRGGLSGAPQGGICPPSSSGPGGGKSAGLWSPERGEPSEGGGVDDEGAGREPDGEGARGRRSEAWEGANDNFLRRRSRARCSEGRKFPLYLDARRRLRREGGVSPPPTPQQGEGGKSQQGGNTRWHRGRSDGGGRPPGGAQKSR